MVWYKANYPKTVAEVLNDNIKFRSATNNAIIKFKLSKPWKGTRKEIKKKFRTLCHDLAEVYGIKEPRLEFGEPYEFEIPLLNGAVLPSISCYLPKSNKIYLESEYDGKYSVVVLLHEFAHALHKDERQACRWSINLFRKHFPKSYAKLIPRRHLLYRPKSPKLKQQPGLN